MKIACVALVKDEERYIAEWIAYQLAIGFDTVLLLDNASTDRTKQIATAFSGRHDVRVFDWPMRIPGFQLRAYEFAVRQAEGEFAWMAFFDTDEFLVMDDSATLKECLSALPGMAAVAVSWAMFGSSGHRDPPPGLVIENYLHRGAADFKPNRHVKSIIRPELMRATIHPHAFEMDGAYADLAGRPVHWDEPGILAGTPDYVGGKLHHYFTRSWADWLAKLRRGNPNRTRSEEEFYIYDRNEIFDDKAAALAPRVNAIAASMAAQPKYRFSIAACARWETPYIVEWLTYHRAIGFDHVFLYCNDDDPAELSEKVAAFTQGNEPFVTFSHHAARGEQAQMYRHFLQNHVHKSEWFGFLDIDEFLHLPADERISDFMARFGPEIDCVLFNWIFFGPNGHKKPPAGPVLTNYTRRSGNLHPLTKYIAKTSALTRQKIMARQDGEFWHSPHRICADSISIVNVLGEDMRDYYAAFEDASPFVNQWNRKSRILATAFIHHYAFRSERAFWERSARGRGGEFGGQTIWRDVAEGDGFAAFLQDVNGIEDRRLAEFWQSHGPVLQDGAGAPEPRLKLGIAITTLNRRDMVLHLVKKLRELTEVRYDLVICDDGSTDETKSALEAEGEIVIGGMPRGIAWNKNRGVYYLLNVAQCDVIVLLDDDMLPAAAGWEAEWLEASWKYGHVNYALPFKKASMIAGAATAADPGLASEIPGCAIGYSRIALAQIGYFDPRFGRYGNEHTDLSFRAIRAGFGGITVQEDGWNATYFYVIEGDLTLLPSTSSATPEDIESSGALFREFFNDPIYRHAWMTDADRTVLLGEIEAGAKLAKQALKRSNHFESLAEYQNARDPRAANSIGRGDNLKNLAYRKPATQSSISEWSRRPVLEQDAAGAVNGKCDGLRKFHTALEDNPWWQVDLGGLAVIHEIRIYNTTENTAFRFRNFSLEVSIDGQARVELVRKEDREVVGGIASAPFIWNGPGTAFARFVRITLLGRDYLHLDQVEVYGTLV